MCKGFKCIEKMIRDVRSISECGHIYIYKVTNSYVYHDYTKRTTILAKYHINNSNRTGINAVAGVIA